MPQIELYAIDYCPFCNAAKALLDSKGLTYNLHNLSELSDRELSEAVQKLSGRTTVPQIWINGKHIGGYTDLDALNRSGELDNILKEVAPSA